MSSQHNKNMVIYIGEGSRDQLGLKAEMSVGMERVGVLTAAVGSPYSFGSAFKALLYKEIMSDPKLSTFSR